MANRPPNEETSRIGGMEDEIAPRLADATEPVAGTKDDVVPPPPPLLRHVTPDVFGQTFLTRLSPLPSVSTSDSAVEAPNVTGRTEDEVAYRPAADVMEPLVGTKDNAEGEPAAPPPPLLTGATPGSPRLRPAPAPQLPRRKLERPPSPSAEGPPHFQREPTSASRTSDGAVESPHVTGKDWEFAASVFADPFVSVDLSSTISDEKKCNGMLNAILPPTTQKGCNSAANQPLDPETMELRFVSLSLVAEVMANDEERDVRAFADPTDPGNPSEVTRPDRPFSDLRDPFEDCKKTSELNEQERRKLTEGDYIDQDVLLGRGGESNHHPGNKDFHKSIKVIFPLYNSLKKKDKDLKTRINKFMVDYVHSQGRRFMKAHAKVEQEAKAKKRRKFWVVADPKDALHKCSQAFRDKKPRIN